MIFSMAYPYIALCEILDNAQKNKPFSVTSELVCEDIVNYDSSGTRYTFWFINQWREAVWKHCIKEFWCRYMNVMFKLVNIVIS